MKIILVGGGSGGPVSPLLAIAEYIKSKNNHSSFLFIGTKNGPESEMVSNLGYNFVSINSGKLRRYFSIANFTTPFMVVVGFFESISILKKFKPDCVVGTGSFVQVPVVFAAWFLRIPVLIHQQDIVPSLANTICQFCVNKITVTFNASLNSFFTSFGIFYSKINSDKVVHTGNPFKASLKLTSKEQALKNLKLNPKFPTLLVLGGGTGSDFINKLVLKSLATLTKYIQIIHSTGKNKMAFVKHENYYAYDFLHNMGDAYAVADIVVSRAGLSTITELSNLKKTSIIIPMPNSHQEANALYLARQSSAIVLNQTHVNPENFITLIRKLLFEHKTSEFLKSNISKIMPHDSAEKISEIIIKIINAKREK